MNDHIKEELPSTFDIGLDGPGWRLDVDPEGEGERLDRFIARRLIRVSRSRAAKLEVWQLNSSSACLHIRLKKSTRLKAGMSLWVKRPLPSEDMTQLDEPYIIDECEDFIVINKPPGWIAHPTASRYQSAITTWLKIQDLKAQPVHRLDLETSGLLLCLKQGQEEAEVRRLFLHHQVDKRYISICKVSPKGEQVLISQGGRWQETQSLGFDTHHSIKIKMGIGTLTALTDFTLIDTWIHHETGTHLALIIARPHTGRQHQIRVHLALNGLSILGDKLYGDHDVCFLKYLDGYLTEDDYLHLGHHRHALHATALSLPWKGEVRCWSSPPPTDLHQYLPPHLLLQIKNHLKSLSNE